MASVSSSAHDTQPVYPANHETGWGVPFVWAAIWAGISVVWVRRDLYQEAEEWEMDKDAMLSEEKGPEP